VVTATPACEPRHLVVAPGNPTGTETCTHHEDCDDEHFCGAGHCRSLTEERVTVCFEELWFEGPAELPPDGQLVFHDRDLCVGCPYYPEQVDSLRSAIATPAGTGCRIAGRRCELVAANVVFRAHMASSHRPYSLVDDGDECDTYRPADQLPYAEAEPGLPMGAFVDAGCVPLAFGEERTAWFSVWYP
jgi:hypothetical protein